MVRILGTKNSTARDRKHMTTARAGRRRRLLHEGASEANSSSNKQASETSSASGVRYAPGVDSLSFSVARRLFPQTPAQVALTTLGTIGIVSLAVLAAYLGAQSIEQPTNAFTYLFAFSGPGTFGTWVASTLWLGVGFVAYILYGIRRHKLDDLKSQYRWWVVAALSAVVMSFITSVDFHNVFANQMTAMTGWSAFANHAVWWLLPGVLLCGGLVIRMAIEQAESKTSLALAILAVIVTSLGWTAEAGLVPESLQASYEWLGYAWLGSALSTFGTAFLLLGNLMYARNIVREADGVIARPEKTASTKSSASSNKRASKSQEPKVEAKSDSDSKSAKSNATEEETTLSIAESTEYESEQVKTEQYYPSKAERRAEAKRRRKEAAAEQTEESDSRWVSGSESDYQDEYDESNGPRKLSKAQRKRLRKQKARRAA